MSTSSLLIRTTVGQFEQRPELTDGCFELHLPDGESYEAREGETVTF